MIIDATGRIRRHIRGASYALIVIDQCVYGVGERLSQLTPLADYPLYDIAEYVLHTTAEIIQRRHGAIP